MNNDALTFRAVCPDDEDFVFEVYASTRSEELSGLQWDENQRANFLKMQFAAQQEDYQRRFPSAEHRLILFNELPIGREYVARDTREIRILEIAILPKHRKKGIGTRLILSLLEEAQRTGRPVRIFVERFNRALGLFQRLGFSTKEDIGSHFLLEWTAQG